jgi:hypothetical protein
MNIPDEHKMTAEQAAPWLAALESGEYQQTTGHLCWINYSGTVQGYCCLGVRAKVAGATFRREPLNDDVVVHIPGSQVDLNDSELLDTQYAQHAFGLSYDVQTLLSRLNDGLTCSIKANDPLIEVYKACAVRATPTTVDGVDLITIENDRHDFKMIAAVVRKYFIR